jgi:hypothetical protein
MYPSRGDGRNPSCNTFAVRSPARGPEQSEQAVYASVKVGDWSAKSSEVQLQVTLFTARPFSQN